MLLDKILLRYAVLCIPRYRFTYAIIVTNIHRNLSVFSQIAKISKLEVKVSIERGAKMDPLAPSGRCEGDSHGGDEGPRVGDQHAPQQGRERRRHHKREKYETIDFIIDLGLVLGFTSAQVPYVLYISTTV